MALPEKRLPNHGFLGSTSFAAVYAEGESLETLPLPWDRHNNQPRHLAPDMDYYIRKGAACLALLEDFPFYEPIVRIWDAQNPISMIVSWVAACESSVKNLYLQMTASTNNQVKQMILDSSAHIFENSFRPLTLEKECTVDQFVDMITGQNLRWEVVGMFYTAVGLAAMTVDDCHLVSQGSAERYGIDTRRRLGRKMLEASDTCKALCERAGQLTDPESWLYCENAHLSTLVEGDASECSLIRQNRLR
jgi:hypothetical protein